MRDYRCAEAREMGARSKIIPGMRVHNRTEPDLIEDRHRFTVGLWKDSPSEANVDGGAASRSSGRRHIHHDDSGPTTFLVVEARK